MPATPSNSVVITKAPGGGYIVQRPFGDVADNSIAAMSTIEEVFAHLVDRFDPDFAEVEEVKCGTFRPEHPATPQAERMVPRDLAVEPDAAGRAKGYRIFDGEFIVLAALENAIDEAGRDERKMIIDMPGLPGCGFLLSDKAIDALTAARNKLKKAIGN